jgi:hypothetical protein
MTSLPSEPVPLRSGRIVDAVADFATLHEAATQLVVWRRALPQSVQRFARELLAANELESLHEVAVADLAQFEPLAAGDAPVEGIRAADPAGAAAFTADVRSLATMFADLTGAVRLGIRLLRLAAPMCPRFHTDFVGVRLLTTYCGTGTEWLDESHVDRRWLGHRSDGVPDHKSGLLRPGAVIQRVAEGAVALLKGEAWPGNRERGAVHRSPAGRGARILLSIDVLDQDTGFDGFDAAGDGHAVPADARFELGCAPGCGGDHGGGA